MTDSEWPNEPHRRKTVLVLNQQDIDALSYKEGGADLLLNEEVYILLYWFKVNENFRRLN